MASDEDNVATLVPWHSHVALEKDPRGDGYIVSHDITKERVRSCSPRPVQLHFDDGVLTCTDRGVGVEPAGLVEYQVLDEVLAKSVYRSGTCEHFVVRAGSDCHKRLQDSMAQCETLDLQVACGPQRLPCSFVVGMLKEGECFGLRLLFSLLELYTKLGLTSHQGQRWNWVGKNWGSWARYLHEALPRHAFAILKGTASPKNERQPSGGPASWRTPRALAPTWLRCWPGSRSASRLSLGGCQSPKRSTPPDLCCFFSSR